MSLPPSDTDIDGDLKDDPLFGSDGRRALREAEFELEAATVQCKAAERAEARARQALYTQINAQLCAAFGADSIPDLGRAWKTSTWSLFVWYEFDSRGWMGLMSDESRTFNHRLHNNPRVVVANLLAELDSIAPQEAIQLRAKTGIFR